LTRISVFGISTLAILAGSATLAFSAELVDMVRELNSDQYRMVSGIAAAREDVAKRVESIDRALPSLPAEELKTETSTWAAATYLLCGGPSKSLRILMENEAFAKSQTALVWGSLAFAEGRLNDARKLLDPLDASLFPTTLAGHLSLVQGGLLLGSDKPNAQRRLKYARLVMPDSLVEEAALRRELLTLDSITQFDGIEKLARRYAEKYSKSPFAPRFWENLRDATVGRALSVDYSKTASMETLLSAMPSPRQVEMHLDISKKAILSARLDIAQEEVAKAKSVARSVAEGSRVQLFLALIAAMSVSPADVALISGVKNDIALTPSDHELKRIVIDAMRQVPTAILMQTALLRKNEQERSTSIDSSNFERPIESSVRKVLAESDELLTKAARE